MEKAEVLIFGYGNPSRGDDALGPLLVDELGKRLPAAIREQAGGIDLLTDFQLQVENALDLAGRRLVLFADAHTACPMPFRLEPLEESPEVSFTTHALHPAAVLRVFRQVHGFAAPPSFLLSLPGERYELGESLSDGAAAALAAATEWVMELCAHPREDEWRQRCTPPASVS